MNKPSNSTPAAIPDQKNKPIIYSMVTPAARPGEERSKVVDIRVNYETVDHLKTEEVRYELYSYVTYSGESLYWSGTSFRNPWNEDTSIHLITFWCLCIEMGGHFSNLDTSFCPKNVCRLERLHWLLMGQVL